MASLLGSLFRRAPQAAPPTPAFPYTIKTNPYRCKRTWPPDFSKLSTKHQFRLERRYRVRAKLKWARPVWTKAVTLAMWGSILGVVVYGVLFMQVDGDRTPFDGIRKMYKEQIGGMNASREQEQAQEVRSDNSPIAERQPS